jgi:hypothetical protein
MKPASKQKPVAKAIQKGQTSPSADHSGHQHVHATGQGRPHPLTQFFGCCLGNDPTPISPKIQAIRENLGNGQTESTIIQPGHHLTISQDMVVADILANFPQSRPFFQELHPLGLLSPALDKISLEIFFSDLPVDLEQICQQLENLVNQKQ